MQPLGLYLSIPFCKAKCTFCNFASDVFAASRMQAYVARLCAEIRQAPSRADRLGAEMPRTVDTIFLGGGTPTLLPPEMISEVFTSIRETFAVERDAEITVECAPGQLSAATLNALVQAGVNRISLGVQSFVDKESAASGRLHTAAGCLAEIARIRSAGVENINLDLICGMPHQTSASLQYSLEQAAVSGVPHVSVYMLEIDEDSRLGRELLAKGHRYSAVATPGDDETAELYLQACEHLEGKGLAQYEISNFARPGKQSRHNRKYWLRDPYLGLGLDAHSMLHTAKTAVRFANPDDLDAYLADPKTPFPIARPAMDVPDYLTVEAVFEESLFLGLRLVEGVDLSLLRERFGDGLVQGARDAAEELVQAGLVSILEGDRLTLTAQGRLLSNEVFSRLLIPELV